ncbi:MAG: sigma-70 family RNA polymerase sigma factor [Caldilineaceae bacterium]|nr:sigma-70 family RNA polymerase sigma factor [Caldilineaceae bacterium]
MSHAALNATEEEAIIQQALHDDINAFNRLVETYERLAYSVAYRMLQNQEQATDAVQESFIKAFRALKTFRGGSFKSWLMRIVTNTCYDTLRARKRQNTDNLNDLAESDEHAPYFIDRAESPGEYAERMELNRLIDQAIATLPEDQRIVILLCDVHGYAYEEICEITGVPMGTVKSRISRARGKLRDYLLANPELLPSAFRPTA